MRKRPAAPRRDEAAPVNGEVSATPETPVSDVTRLEGAFDSLDDGVVVVDAEGKELLRNEAAERFHGARHADALAEHVVGCCWPKPVRGEPRTASLALFGPPREVLTIRGVPCPSTAMSAVARLFVTT